MPEGVAKVERMLLKALVALAAIVLIHLGTQGIHDYSVLRAKEVHKSTPPTQTPEKSR